MKDYAIEAIVAASRDCFDSFLAKMCFSSLYKVCSRDLAGRKVIYGEFDRGEQALCMY